MTDYADREALIKELEKHSDEAFRAFQLRLIKSRYEILGVRTPQLRSVAKEILRTDAKAFLENCKPVCFEEVMLKAFVLAGQRVSLESKLKSIDSFISEIDNWAVCDGFCSALKPQKDEMSVLYEFVKKHIYAKDEYEIRVAVVLALDYLITDKYIDSILDILVKVDCSYYYTSMAVAWAYSVCYVMFTEKTYAFLKNHSIDKPTLNRTVRKIIDSYRVSDSDKQSARELL